MEGFYDELLEILAGHRVISSIINAPCKRIYANTFFNKNKFEEWLDDPELDTELHAKENVDSNGSVDAAKITGNRKLTAETLNGGNLSVSGEIKYNGKSIIEHIYPVGSIYINANDSQNPKYLLGFGQWSIIGEQRVLVSAAPWDSDFSEALKMGGAEKVTLQEEHLPTHKHDGETTSVESEPHYHSVNSVDFTVYRKSTWGGGGDGALRRTDREKVYTDYSDAPHDHDIQIRSTGGNQEHENVQPYITVYIWRRTS